MKKAVRPVPPRWGRRLLLPTSLDLLLPNRLKQLREAQGHSLAALASKVGTTGQQISHLELGKRHLTIEWLERLAEALECHPWSIVSERFATDLNEREQRLLEAFRTLREHDQLALMDEAVTRVGCVGTGNGWAGSEAI